MGRSKPRSTICSLIFGASAKTGAQMDSNKRVAIVLIGPGIIRYAKGMQRNARKHGYASTHSHGTLLLILVFCSVSFGQQPGGIAQTAAIPGAELEKMDRRELGDSWRADVAPKLRNAHELLEKYFAAKSTPERVEAVKEIVATTIDP